MDRDRTLAEARAELATLTAHKEQAERRIIALKRIIEGLEYLAQEDQGHESSPANPPMDLEPIGVTDFIRMLLRTCSYPMRPTDVRDAIKLAERIEGSESENLLNHVHNVLVRLAKNNEIEPVEGPDGKTCYRWVSDLRRRLEEIEPTPDEIERFRTRFNMDRFTARFKDRMLMLTAGERMAAGKPFSTDELRTLTANRKK